MDNEPKARRDGPLPEGVEVREGTRGARLRVVFKWLGERRRETLTIPATPSNIKYAGRLRAEVVNAIERGTFDYAHYFPNSKTAKLQARGKRRYLLTELIDGYIDAARKAKALSPSSIATYAKWNQARLKPKFEGKFIDELAPPEMREWIAELVAELAPKSVLNCVGVVSAVLNQAVEDQLIPANPLGSIQLKKAIPKKRREDDKIDPFNQEEIAAILSACQHIEERSLFQYAFSSGLRTGELIAVKWPHIDWIARLARVQDNVVSGEVGTVEKATKTDCERDVPFLPSAEAALMAMKPISLLKDIGGYVFCTPSGQRWRDDHQIRARWTIILRKAGVRYRNPYQTRHTFASTLLMNGEPELLVARLLGHTTVEMVRRSYGKYIRQPNGITFRGDYATFGAIKIKVA